MAADPERVQSIFLAAVGQDRPADRAAVLDRECGPDAELLDRLVTASAQAPDAPRLPRIYPVLIGGDELAGDVSVERVSLTQTNFEDAPVTLAAQINAHGYDGRTLLVQLLDEEGKEVERRKVVAIDDPAAPKLAVRFHVRPRQAGLSRIFWQTS